MRQGLAVAGSAPAKRTTAVRTIAKARIPTLKGPLGGRYACLFADMRIRRAPRRFGGATRESRKSVKGCYAKIFMREILDVYPGNCVTIGRDSLIRASQLPKSSQVRGENSEGR